MAEPSSPTPDLEQIIQEAREAALQTAALFIESRRQQRVLPSASPDPLKNHSPTPREAQPLEKRENRTGATPLSQTPEPPSGQLKMTPAGALDPWGSWWAERAGENPIVVDLSATGEDPQVRVSPPTEELPSYLVRGNGANLSLSFVLNGADPVTIDWKDGLVTTDDENGKTLTINTPTNGDKTGQILYWNGLAWIPLDPPEIDTFSALTHPGGTVPPAWSAMAIVPKGTVTGDMLYWDGAQWVTLYPPQSPAVLTHPGGHAAPSWSPLEPFTCPA
jgi:hypothetical protein